MNLDNECWVCGESELFNVCIDCGVEIYTNTDGSTDPNGILKYIQDNKPERFTQILEQYELDKAIADG